MTSPIEQLLLAHQYSDADAGPISQHHTLGIQPGQASPGNHTHDGKNSMPINTLENFRDYFVWPPGTSTVGPEYVLSYPLNIGWSPADVYGTDGPPSFRKDAVGIVRMRGIAKYTSTAPPADSIIAVLPAGYRPRDYIRCVCHSVNGFGVRGFSNVSISKVGEVIWNDAYAYNGTASDTSLSWVSLDMITFLGEN